MASKAHTSRAAFVAALTATDQLTARDRKEAASVKREADKGLSYGAWMEARAAFHATSAANILAMCGRVNGKPNASELTDQSERAGRHFIVVMDRYIRSPIIRKTDIAERRTNLRSWTRAFGGIAMAGELWMRKLPEWQAVLDGFASERATA